MLNFLLVLACWLPPQSPETPTVHSVSDISQRFTFYLDGRFHRQYLAEHGKDVRNWGSLGKLDLDNANLLVLSAGDPRIPYAPQAIQNVERFLKSGGTVLLMDEGASHPGAALASHFGITSSNTKATGAATATAELLQRLELTEMAPTFRGGHTMVLQPGWIALLEDQNEGVLLALRSVGKGHLLLGSRGLFGQKPD
ncbi:MAG: hypothetical protein ACI9F9_000486, partial [Candidatus Paceibacteria bacterium]